MLPTKKKEPGKRFQKLGSAGSHGALFHLCAFFFFLFLLIFVSLALMPLIERYCVNDSRLCSSETRVPTKAKTYNLEYLLAD